MPPDAGACKRVSFFLFVFQEVFLQHITLNIDGMTCNGCVASVTKILQGVDGVASAEVSLADKRAEVAFDATKTSVDALIAAVEDGGYDASL